MFKIRINNIECRQTTYKPREYEIVKWYKNDYYGTEQKLIEEGFNKIDYGGDDWGMTNGNYTINKSCFQNPESCCVIAWLELNHREPDINMITVGGRVLELEADELDVFMRVYRVSHNMILEQINENEKD